MQRKKSQLPRDVERSGQRKFCGLSPGSALTVGVARQRISKELKGGDVGLMEFPQLRPLDLVPSQGERPETDKALGCGCRWWVSREDRGTLKRLEKDSVPLWDVSPSSSQT